ncbi:uncharacterized protein LOC126965334 [Leptidea sinapis]|uniref:uncharacterized protein LOC126965334 n=1 Tax=Leptidea sinapis TaxID=189913 RepID=UPI002127D7F3|nr:uncharacterized protein LOC126965334 [Leptidea sinapis]
MNSDKMNSREYREMLIDEVKKFPVLYDTRHENHRDIDVRDRCWMEISERLGVNCEILKREWKILRDSLRQSLKKSKDTTKSGQPCKKWRFQNRMAFVLPHMTIRRNRRLVKDDIKIDEEEVQTDPDPECPEPWESGNTDQDDSLDLFFASICQSVRRLPKKYQNMIKRQVLESLLAVEENYEMENAENKK